MRLISGTGLQRAAKLSQVLVGGAALTYASWKADPKAADLDTTNFQSYQSGTTPPATFDEGIVGPLSCDMSFGGDWDAGTNPLDPGLAPGLYPRDDLTNLQFVTARTDTPSPSAWIFNYARILGVSNGGEVGGKVTFSVGSAKSQGPFTVPLGNAPAGT